MANNTSHTAPTALHGTLGTHWGIDTIQGALGAAGGEPVHFTLNSKGGDLGMALDILGLLQGYGGRVSMQLHGIVASAATVAAMGADELTIAPSALMMLHRPWAPVQGNSAALRKAARVLDRYAEAMASAYIARSRQSPEAIRQLMDSETWLSAPRAIALGLADRIAEPVKPTFRNSIIHNQIPMSTNPFESLRTFAEGLFIPKAKPAADQTVLAEASIEARLAAIEAKLTALHPLQASLKITGDQEEDDHANQPIAVSAEAPAGDPLPPRHTRHFTEADRAASSFRTSLSTEEKIMWSK